MARESPEALNRYVLGIAGRHEAVPANVFYYGSQRSEPPITATAPMPELDYVPLMEDVLGAAPPLRVTQRQIVFRDVDGRPLPPMRIPDNITGEWLRKAVANRGLTDERLADMICEPEDRDLPQAEWDAPGWLRGALLTALPRARRDAQTHGINVWWLTSDGLIQHDLPSPIKINLPIEYPRALAKIALHYALMVDANLTGHETGLAAIKAYIRDGQGDFADFVDLAGRPFVIHEGASLRGVHHFLFLEITRDNEIKVRIHFFVNGRYPVSPILVRLGTDVYTRNTRIGHAIRVFPAQQSRFHGELLTLEVVKHDGIWGTKAPPWSRA